eukprot:TRINITY_DN8577_c0_g1_i1.p1 TRINITY_DN8577_c0_g1~~TRINITY_DN8577_c0_g1_i1.p1  ORF type:complete len:313 (+),score=39.22 TRINITY_DN8577_c0_g1_i1:160-1098(+)
MATLCRAIRRLNGSPVRKLTPMLGRLEGSGIHTCGRRQEEQGTKGTASFGYRTVPEDEKSKLVGGVFTSVASSYDVMNDMMSFGMHRLWKDRLVAELAPFPGIKVIDVAGGTGDIAFRIQQAVLDSRQRDGNRVPPRREEDEDEEDRTRVVVCDINPAMLRVGQQRANARGWGSLPSLVWMEGDAEALPMESGSMDAYTVAFGIRNVTHIDAALREAYRVLRPGGRFLCLELSHVRQPMFRSLYDLYSFQLIPTMGELIAKDRDSYQYLVESIRRFPMQERFAQMISSAGFQDVRFENLVGGVVAIHSGFKW